MSYPYFNEAGEPLMDAAAMRFEQELDAQSMEEAWEERWLDSYDEEPDEFDGPEHDDEDTEPWEAEDGWLDGSYEE